MKKIFAVYADVEIENKPKWLTEFRKKYSEPYDFHVTLKQPVCIEESEIPELKEKLTCFFDNQKQKGSFGVVFNELSQAADKTCVMIGLEDENSPIFELQKGLINTLSGYNEYTDPVTEKFEKDFRPHITIGDKLNHERYEQALNDLPEEIRIESKISKIVLVVVQEQTIEEALNPKNLTNFVL